MPPKSKHWGPKKIKIKHPAVAQRVVINELIPPPVGGGLRWGATRLTPEQSERLNERLAADLRTWEEYNATPTTQERTAAEARYRDIYLANVVRGPRVVLPPVQVTTTEFLRDYDTNA